MPKLARQSAFISFLSFLTWLTLLNQALAANEVFLSNDTAQFEATWVIQFVTSVKGTTDTIRITLPPDSNAANAALGRVIIGASVFESNNDVQMSVDPLDPNRLIVHLTVPFNLKTGTQILIELFNLMNPASGNYAIAASTIDQRGNVLETVAIGFTTFDTGDITAVNAGAGLAGGGTTGDVTLSVASSYQLPQGCPSGQVAKSNGAGGWTCAADNNSGGTVTSVGTGPGLIGGPILTTGTVSVATGGITSAMIAPNAVDSSKILDGSIGSIDVNSAQIQLRVTPGCSAGSAIRVVNPDGTVACEPAGISGSGTANFLAKFTGTTTIGDSSIFESSSIFEGDIMHFLRGGVEKMRLRSDGSLSIGTTQSADTLTVAGGIALNRAGARVISFNDESSNTKTSILGNDDRGASLEVRVFNIPKFIVFNSENASYNSLKVARIPNVSDWLRFNFTGNDANIQALNAGEGAATDLTLQPSGGKVAIGSGTPTERLHVFGNAAISGLSITAVQAETIADNGGGTPAAATITPSKSYININCQDPEGCDVTLDQTGAVDGAVIRLVNVSPNNVNFADTAGVSELAGAFSAGQWSTLSLIFVTDRWVELARSSN